MPIEPFGPWRPDQPALGSSGIPVAKDCTPETTGYGPFSSLSPASASGITERPMYFSDFKDSEGTTFVFAGSQNNLWRLDAGTGLFEKVSRAAGYNVPSQGRWDMQQYGDTIFACNNFDDIQSFSLGASTVFADVPGAAGFSPRQFAIIRDHLFGAAMYENGNDQAFRVRWSAFGNPFDWVRNPKGTQADFQDVAGLGNMKGITGGEFGTILMENGIVRVEKVGGRAIFQFDEVEGAPGCIETNSIIRVKGTTYYFGSDGLKAFNGQQVFNLGLGKFDDWLQKEVTPSGLHRVSAIKAESKNLVLWGFPGQGASGEEPNRILVFNYATGEATFADIDHAVLGYAASPGFLLDDIAQDIETLPAPLDDAYWLGGARYGASMNLAGELRAFGGPPLTAELHTRELHSNAAITISDAEILAEGPSDVTVNVGIRSQINDLNPVFGPDRTQQPSGGIPCRDTGKYVRMKARVDGENWSRVLGIKYNEGMFR